MTTQTAAIPSVTHSDRLDVQLIVTFTPADPIGLTVVEIDDQDVSPAHYLRLVEDAAERLTVYADTYRQAAESDTEGQR